MNTVQTIGTDFSENLQLIKYQPVGLYISDEKPGNAIELKKKGNGCIVPLILKASTGQPVVFSEDSTGWPCSAFYLGFQDSIFEGIEYFLSTKDDFWRPCERFIENPALAKSFIDHVQAIKPAKRYVVFKLLSEFTGPEEPEVVLFFVNPDQLSALVYLTHFDAPEAFDRIITPFASACMTLATLPLKLARNNEQKAVCGLHDLSARARLPKDLLSIAYPYPFLKSIWQKLPDTFMQTELWQTIKKRINQD